MLSATGLGTRQYADGGTLPGFLFFDFQIEFLSVQGVDGFLHLFHSRF